MGNLKIDCTVRALRGRSKVSIGYVPGQSLRGDVLAREIADQHQINTETAKVFARGTPLSSHLVNGSEDTAERKIESMPEISIP